MTTRHTSEHPAGLPPVHKYHDHASAVLRFSRMHRDPAWREAVGLSVTPSRFWPVLCIAGILVSPAFLYCCFYL